MTDFPQSRSDPEVTKVAASIRGSGHAPLAFGEDIHAGVTKGGHNDLKTVMGAVDTAATNAGEAAATADAKAVAAASAASDAATAAVAARSAAATADAKAVAAQTTATAAGTAASTADAKAVAARSAAATADAKAVAAQTTATAAGTAASTADAKAVAARSAAATADAKAVAAQTTATAAGTAASTADAKAVAAASAASDAATAAAAARSAAATADGKAVAAQTTANAALPKAGGTMTGKIVLDGAPTADLHAASKKYVDDNAGTGNSSGLSSVETDDTLTGDGSSGDPLSVANPWTDDELIDILANIEDVVDYGRFTGDWAAQAYTAGQIAKASDGNYYEALRDLANTVAEPTATTADWKLLPDGLDKTTAIFHEYLRTLGSGTVGGLDITEVGSSVAVSGAAVGGPLVAALNEVFLVELTYTRTQTGLHMWSTMRKSEDLTTTPYRLQLQGAGGAYIDLSRLNDNVLLSNNGFASAGVSDLSIRFFNISAGRGEKGDPGAGIQTADGRSLLLPDPTDLPSGQIVKTASGHWVAVPDTGGGGTDADDSGGSVHIWVKHTDAPTGEINPTGIAFDSNDVLHLVGIGTDDVWSYNGSTWTKVADAPSGEGNPHGIAFDSNDVLHLVGTNIDDVWSYNGSTWTKVADAPTGESNPAGIAFDSNDVLHLTGSATDDVWSYNGSTWTKVADAPTGEIHPTGIAFDSNDVLHLVGIGTDDVWSYNGSTWTKVADAPSGEGDPHGIAFDSNDVLHLVGIATDDVFAYHELATAGSGTDRITPLTDVNLWQGTLDATRAYVEGQEFRIGSTYYRATADFAAGAGVLDTNYEALAGIDLATAKFHEYLIERHKVFTADWGSLPVGTVSRVGDHVKRFLQWFVCEVEHNKGATGPDNDPTRWSPVTNYAGEYDGTKYYHEGVYTEYRGKLAFSLEDITPSDPVPDHRTNSKWWYPPNDYNGIFRPWRYVEPSGGLDDLEIDSTDAASGQVETVTPDIDEDRILVHSIRAAEAAGIQTQMHISGTVKYFLKQDAPLSNSSGAILTVGLWVGADPRTGQGRFLHELDRNILTLADFRNSNGGRDAYGSTADVEKNFSLLVDETDFATWDLAQHEELVFILYGNNINGAASVKAELSDVVISYDRSTANIDHLREEIEDQLRALVQHQEIIVDELPDPAGAAAPDYAYLSRVWRPTQGFTGNQGVVEYSPGEYQRTTGTANRAKFLFSNGTYNDGNTDRDIIGFIQRGNRLRVGSAHFLENVGEAIHNPVGGAVAGIFFTHDPSNVLAGGSASWVLWVKRSLASRKPPWNVPTNIEQGGFKVRLYHDSTSFDIKFAHGGSFEVIDGIEYEYYYAPTTTGLSWINNLNLNDVAASTIEIEFRRESDNQLYWLGDEAEGWTWRDPDENPTSISRIDKIERGSLIEGALLASMTGPASPGQITNRPWTIPAGVSGVTQSNSGQHPTGNWTRYLYIDPDIYCHSLAGSHGLLIVAKRGGTIVSSSYLPFTTAHAQWVADDEIFAGKWKTGVSHANTLYAGWGADSGRLHLVLSCSGADNQTTVEIHRTN